MTTFQTQKSVYTGKRFSITVLPQKSAVPYITTFRLFLLLMAIFVVVNLKVKEVGLELDCSFWKG